MHSALNAVAVLCALLALAGAAYFAMSIIAARRFQRERSRLPVTRFTPPVSILRSLKGLDPQMYSAFRSHCVLDYPEYEVLFGVSDPERSGAGAWSRSYARNFRKLSCALCIVRRCSASTARSAILPRC